MSSKESTLQSTQDEFNLDIVIKEEVGAFGIYQIRNHLMCCLVVIFSALGTQEYVFTAASLPHRCLIPECDDPNPVYEPTWLGVAVPGSPGSFDRCSRFEPVNTTFANDTEGICPANYFNTNRTIGCDSYVHERINTVVYDYGLQCQEWRRSFIGTFSTIGTLLALPITGFISDRFGRRLALILNAFNRGLFGLIRAWSINYEMFLILELVEATLGSGAYSSAYLLATELVGSKWRVLAGVTITTSFSLGTVLLGFIAWAIPQWNTLIIVLYTPQLVVLIYFFILQDSVRWLLSKGKYDQAEKALIKAAKINGKAISQKSLEALTATAIDENIRLKTEPKKENVLKQIIRSPVLLKRICTTPIWWVTSTLIYYGLSINSVSLAGNMYVNYILVAAVEIPGTWTAFLILDRIGRKKTLCGAYYICALTSFIFPFIPNNLAWLSLLMYLVGKFSISMVMASIYIYTTELYPTNYRHSLLGFSSMVGRIGSIIAPLTPALMVYWVPMPSMIFGVMSLISGSLVLTTPETLNCKLPDTIEEAEAIGRTKYETS